MLIQMMTRVEAINLLKRTKLGRMACAHEGQPYITPITFAYDADFLYSFSIVGQKIAWMRKNPLVCLEADDILSNEDWASVIVFGAYEELPHTKEYESLREWAYLLLQKEPFWWEPAYVKTTSSEGKERPLEGLYFRIRINDITGRRALPDRLHQPHATGLLQRFFRSAGTLWTSLCSNPRPFGFAGTAPGLSPRFVRAPDRRARGSRSDQRNPAVTP